MPLADINAERPPRARMTLAYAGPGFGKTTFLAGAPTPICLGTEDGQYDVKMPNGKKLPVYPFVDGSVDGGLRYFARTWEELIKAIAEIHDGDHEYQTFGLDTATGVEPLIYAAICEQRGVSTIEDIDYGKGYAFALDYWQQLIDWLKALRDNRGMEVIILAHDQLEKYDHPLTDSWDKFKPRMHKNVWPKFVAECDEVFYGAIRVAIQKTKTGFKKVTRARNAGRAWHTLDQPAYVAKRRLPFPDFIPLELPNLYARYAEYRTAIAAGKVIENVVEADEDETTETPDEKPARPTGPRTPRSPRSAPTPEPVNA